VHSLTLASSTSRSLPRSLVDATTGTITVGAAGLDYEVAAEFDFNVVATNALAEVAAATKVAIHIAVTDFNDNAPEFTEPDSTTASGNAIYSGQVLEDAALGTEVKTMHSTDADAGENGRIAYAMVSSTDGAFAVDATTGTITTIKALNREDFIQYVVEIQATDHGPADNGGALATNAIITFVTLDSNDNDPVFDQPAGYAFAASENTASTDLSIGEVTATDLDEGINGEMTFSISTAAPGAGEHFAILDGSSGKIYVVKALDRELAASHVLNVCVVDKGVPVRQACVDVTVTVLDLNDNAPIFSQPAGYTTDMDENEADGAVVNLDVAATDIDAAANGDIVYTISGGAAMALFAIDSATGQVSVVNGLDRETMGDALTFVVTATDQASVDQKFTDVSVTVDVNDLNDNSPIFAPAAYTVQTPEDIAVDGEVVTVSAGDIDLDATPFSTITYTITQGNDAGRFAVDAVTGVVTMVDSLDRERAGEAAYTLTIAATDGGARVATTTLAIEVMDVNDNAPVFQATPYAADLTEGKAVGEGVFVVQAADADKAENQVVQFAIVSGNVGGAFAIDADSGETFRSVDHVNWLWVQALT
jgi:protocadherin Fat 4